MRRSPNHLGGTQVEWQTKTLAGTVDLDICVLVLHAIGYRGIRINTASGTPRRACLASLEYTMTPRSK